MSILSIFVSLVSMLSRISILYRLKASKIVNHRNRYRGEGANHGILDAALLIDQLKKVKAGEITQKEAIDTYEAEMRPRTHEAVLQSRQAALEAHDWDVLSEESPVIGGRIAPKTAFL